MKKVFIIISVLFIIVGFMSCSQKETEDDIIYNQLTQPTKESVSEENFNSFISLSETIKKHEKSYDLWGNIYNIPNNSTILQCKDSIIYNEKNCVYIITDNDKYSIIEMNDSITNISIKNNYLIVNTSSTSIKLYGYTLEKVLN